MKKLLATSLLLVCIMLLIFSTIQAQTTGSNSASGFPSLSLGNIISALLITYEAIIRIVPTVKNNSIVHSIIVILSSISDFLNVKKKN